MTAGWSAGAARVPYIVPIGTPMAGYAARSGPSVGVLDELTVSALYLSAGDRRFVLVAADIAAVDAALVGEVASAADVDPSELVLCASHTHSGPAGVVTRMHPGDTDQRSPALREKFVHACVQAIDAARARSEPVELSIGAADTSGLAANRNAPGGPFDPRVSVLATRNHTGQLTAALVHFACHPTILSAENRLLSADFPGALRRAAEPRLAQHGVAPVVLYVNGAAGDISTRFTRAEQDYTEVERVGTGLAAAAGSVLEHARDVQPGIESARVSVTLEPRVLEAAPELELSDAMTKQSAGERRKAETRAQGAMLLDRLARAGPEAIQRTFELPAWQLGDVRLIAIPGELFASLGARITESVLGPALVLGYANGYIGYLVDEAAEFARTYEALASPFAPGAGDRVANAAVTVMSQT
jgi:hypothetical protein